MQISLEGRDFSAPLQPSTPACETCSISISDGVYLSNLLPSDLYAAHSGESAPAADSLCVLSGQSAPLSWRWQKSTAGGPCIALGLSAQSTAQVAQLLQSGRAKDSAEAWAANASPTWQRAGPAAPAEPETSSARGAGAAPSLASSFADFLEGQASSSRGPPAQPWGSEWQSGASEGIIDLSVHRGRRTLIVLRGSDGQVGSCASQPAGAPPSVALSRQQGAPRHPSVTILYCGSGPCKRELFSWGIVTDAGSPCRLPHSGSPWPHTHSHLQRSPATCGSEQLPCNGP